MAFGNLFKWTAGDDRSSATGGARRAPLAAAPAPVKSVNGKYAAVALLPCARPCEAAVKLKDRGRILASEAPSLPLAGCHAAGSCTCRYQKYADRRQDDRRLSLPGEVSRWYHGNDRRDRRGRRRDD